jgi:CheY-like chemotaxis protein
MPLEILAAEDDPGEACLMQEAFKAGARASRLHLVRNGVELMSFLRREGEYAASPRPDLILLDLNMPIKSGMEALAELKVDGRLKSIPVIVLSTSTAHEDIAGSYALHANCYVSKPADLHRFIEMVKSIEHYWSAVVALPSHC